MKLDFWNPDNLKTISGGRWLARAKPNAAISGLSTDSRVVRPTEVFLALRGEKFDGHAFLAQASAQGSPLLIIESEPAFTDAKPSIPDGTGVLLVDDTARTLLRLAQAYRRTLTTTKVIAVGGSNGKTTTVRLIDAALSTHLRGRASLKSFNNAVGVPLTILQAQPTDQYLICEVGTNAPGEIATLAAIVEPDICVITSLGREHLEGLGTIEGVAREEATLVGTLREGGCAIVACDDTLVAAVRSQLRNLPGEPRVLVTFGATPAPNADIRVECASQTFDGVTFTLNDRTDYTLPLLGLHNASNAAAAIGVARRMGLSADEARPGLAKVTGPAMRLERTRIGGIAIINDAYNANPESALAAIHTFREVAASTPHTRRVVVLGDMLELGDHAPALHAEVGAALAQAPCADLIILVGSLVAHTEAAIKATQPDATITHLPDVAPPRDVHAASLLRDGDLVLLKASRGMGLERMIKVLARTHQPPAELKPAKTPQSQGAE